MPMVKDPLVVIVVGAGGSKPYGLPLGVELRDSILSFKNGLSYRTLEECGFSSDEYKEFCESLRTSGMRTVDEFLEKRPKWLEIGKCCIGIALGLVRYGDFLFPPDQPKDHWYEELWRGVFGGSWGGLKKANVRVVTFNYDKSLETYLAHVAANNVKGLHVDKAMGWLNDEMIVHVHGAMDQIDAILLGRRFLSGAKSTRVVQSAMKSIIVVSESVGRTKEFVTARKWLWGAEHVVFAGFGFHEANMSRLGFREGKRLFAGRVSLCRKGLRISQIDRMCRRYFTGSRKSMRVVAGSLQQLMSEGVPKS